MSTVRGSRAIARNTPLRNARKSTREKTPCDKGATTAPLFRADHWDAADRDAGFDFTTNSTIRSAEMGRLEKVVKAALYVYLFAKSDKGAMREMREHIEGLGLPLYRLVRLNELAISETWPPEHWGPAKPACEPKPGHGCTYEQWREAAFLVHRAALSLLLEVEPQSYADVHDQLQMLFYSTPISLREGQRRKLKARLTGQVARLVSGLPFADRSLH